ncbi:hypothetical protein RFI_15148 [Reticulomyxa filosa]|uniref:Uncharacterized protein n=1 Tax=Reticulomyxa filosa TaxID=46433 RepID=X6N704_RETFI|nr:hypothetical protein RFI_15148 [Reticulomyxa filosa]|eukprot:ETO22055.1 hypothetical protein RFI_15148 [Reticulomyxa filosa]
MEQLQVLFSTIEAEIVSKTWNLCNENLDETSMVLSFIAENNTTSQQQLYLMELLEKFDNIDKTTILRTWKQSNQIYYDTIVKLRKAVSTYNINKLKITTKKKKKLFENKRYLCILSIKERNEMKIMREVCLYILWNIISYPTNMKYRQISTNSFYQILKRKCDSLSVNVDELFVDVEYFLKEWGFQKGNDCNWYYHEDIQLLLLWKCYQSWIYEQPMYYFYKTRVNIPGTICMLSNGKWKKYENCVIEWKNLKVKTLQVGNPKRSSLEFNVHIQWYNDCSEIQTSCIKYCCLILDHSWHLRTINYFDREHLSNCCSEFNSFQAIHNRDNVNIFKEPLNPYSMTLKQGLQCFKEKLQIRQQSLTGEDELVRFNCNFDKCKPPIPLDINEDILLNDIYKHLPHYPNIQVNWNILSLFVVPYKHTICIERTDVPKNIINEDIVSLSNQKPKFNPLLYECDFHKFKIIEDTVTRIYTSSKNELKLLLHEVIKNGYLSDLITCQYKNNKREEKQRYENIKQQIHYKDSNADELILNDKILTIINELETLYHEDIHKQIGYPLSLENICAILLYCGKACNVEFSYDQIHFQHFKWKSLDKCLQSAIMILHTHERREEENIELYCGLKGVRLKNEKEIKAGFFISHISTSDDLQVAKMFRTDQGCILHFHSSMRRANLIDSCDVSWISPYKHEREILFARTRTEFNFDEKKHKELIAWNAKIESEDKKTQMILLTWAMHDQFIQQTVNISKIWNHSIDLNLIHMILFNTQGNVDLTIQCLATFKEWRMQPNNKKKYEEIKNEFLERRCCNHHINFFFIFFEKEVPEYTSIELAILFTLLNGLPFEKFEESERTTNKK